MSFIPRTKTEFTDKRVKVVGEAGDVLKQWEKKKDTGLSSLEIETMICIKKLLSMIELQKEQARIDELRFIEKIKAKKEKTWTVEDIPWDDKLPPTKKPIKETEKSYEFIKMLDKI